MSTPNADQICVDIAPISKSKLIKSITSFVSNDTEKIDGTVKIVRASKSGDQSSDQSCNKNVASAKIRNIVKSAEQRCASDPNDFSRSQFANEPILPSKCETPSHQIYEDMFHELNEQNAILKGTAKEWNDAYDILMRKYNNIKVEYKKLNTENKRPVVVNKQFVDKDTQQFLDEKKQFQEEKRRLFEEKQQLLDERKQFLNERKRLFETEQQFYNNNNKFLEDKDKFVEEKRHLVDHIKRLHIENEQLLHMIYAGDTSDLAETRTANVTERPVPATRIKTDYHISTKIQPNATANTKANGKQSHCRQLGCGKYVDTDHSVYCPEVLDKY